jgi:hypothetical protein
VAAGTEDDPISAAATLPEWPFPEPDTALTSMIDGADEENLIGRFFVRPAAPWRESACFQSLTPRLNNLQIFSMTYEHRSI